MIDDIWGGITRPVYLIGRVVFELANIFKSKEVYKRIPRIDPALNPLRAVRGVYVSGPWKPPYYITPAILISNIESTPATVVDFTELETDAGPDYLLNVLELSATVSTVVEYTKVEVESSPDYLLNVLELSCTPTSTVWYTRAEAESSPDYLLNVLELSCTPSNVVYYNNIWFSSNPEPMLMITAISTTTATIANA
jgi:hypothetical protein